MVADVSGHGVPAGAVMGVLKASVRTRLRTRGDLGALVADVNDVLAELTRPNTFATAAVLALESPGRLSYVLAGHLPILHRDAASGRVSRLAHGCLALGIRPGEPYAPTARGVTPGDVLAVLTDGFTETMDRDGRELGLEPFERALASHGDETLPLLFERLLEIARGFGPQQDDRTLLLVRIGAA
jgi:sigma-B regulation protein RsbU (phosphoserine phosphatase)